MHTIQLILFLSLRYDELSFRPFLNVIPCIDHSILISVRPLWILSRCVMPFKFEELFMQ